MFKKGEALTSGKDVAILLLLIAVFVVLYVLLLPPAEREALLNETSNVSGQQYGAVVTQTLLSE